jgi:hypothetical protein
MELPIQILHPLPPDLITPKQEPVDIVTMAKGLPNYSLMKFGRRNY